VKRGGVYVRVNAHDRVKEGGRIHCGRSMAWERGGAAPMARWHERRQRHCWCVEGGWRRGGGLGLVGWLGLSGRSGPGGLFQPAWPLGPKGRVGWLGLPGHSGRKSNKISFVIKIEFLNMPMLWKFAQGNL
jgi:hypothetical protein